MTPGVEGKRPLRRGRRSLREPVVWLALLLVASGAARVWDLGRRSPGIDFYQFWVVAHVVGEGHAERVYDDASREEMAREFQRRALVEEASERRRVAAEARPALEPFGTPFLYTALSPFTTGSYEHDFHRYRLVSLAGLLGAALLLGRVLRYRAAACLVLLGLLLHVFQPLKADVRVGNVNQLLLAALAAYLWLGGRADRSGLQAVAGALLGIATLFKPTLAAVLPLLAASWALRRRYTKLALQTAGLAAGAAVTLAASGLFFGSLAPWGEWLMAVRALPQSAIPVDRGNFGLARLAHEELGLRIAPHLALVALGAVVTCLWLRSRGAQGAPAEATRPDRTPAIVADDAAVVAAGCLVYLLSAPLVWQHYLLLALPAVFVLLGRRRERGRRSGWQALPAVVAFAAIAIDPYAELLQVHDLTRQATVVSAGLVVLFVLTLGELCRGARLGARAVPPAAVGEAPSA